MNELERLDNVLNHKPVDRQPCICPMHTGAVALMRAAEAFYPEVQDHADKMARLAKAAHDVAGFENVRVPFDESIEASCFGIHTGQKGLRRQPLVLERLIKAAEDVDKLQIPDPRRDGKTKVALEAVEILQGKIAHVPIFLGIMSPLMLAMQLRGDHETMVDMVKDRQLLASLLDKTTDFILDYTREGVRAGVDMIVLDDSLSNSDFLTLEQFTSFAEPYEDRVANELRKLDIESILHVCGNVTPKQLDRMIEIDVDAISIDQEVPIRTARGIAARRNMLVIGNICPTKTLLMGDSLKVEAETKKCIDEGVDAVAPGCSLEMHTPLENLKAMVEATKRYGRPMTSRTTYIGGEDR